MKTLRAAALCCVFVLVCAPSAWAESHTRQPTVAETAKADTMVDLDGDGRGEWIKLTWYEDPTWYYPTQSFVYDCLVISIGGSMIADRGDAMVPKLYVVDIDSTDGRKEIAVKEYGPSDDDATHFYRYVSGSITKLGILPGHATGPPSVDGSGEIETECRGSLLHTWSHPCRFRVATYEQAFEPVPQEYYEMSTPVRLKVDLEVVRAPRDSVVVGMIRAGESARPLRTDDAYWCEIESESGVRGWFPVLEFDFIPTVRREAIEVFDGLTLAD